jgi:hypothetical protein
LLEKKLSVADIPRNPTLNHQCAIQYAAKVKRSNVAPTEAMGKKPELEIGFGRLSFFFMALSPFSI